jgi:hypothetical protein
MCWNPDVSLSTFVFATAAIVIGYITRQHDLKWSVFYLSFALMQLLEFFLWKNLTKPMVNKVFSLLGLLLIMLQPVAAGLLIADNKYKPIYYALYALWLVIYFMTSLPITLKTQKAPNGHLSWLWLKPSHGILIVIWLLFIIAAVWLSSISTLAKAILTLTLAAFTYVSWWYYHNQQSTWGSVYCSFINLVFIVVIAKSFWSQYCR